MNLDRGYSYYGWHMLHILAQTAVTVTETVTSTPTPVPVEIVNQPSSGWQANEMVTAFLSVLAIVVSFLNFYVGGPIARTTFNFRERVDKANPPKLWFSITNRGRGSAPVDMLLLSNYKKTDGGFPISGGDFPLPGGPDGDYEMVEVKPGEIVSVDIPLECLECHRANLEAELVESGVQKSVSFRDFYITTVFAGRELKKKIPRRVAARMKRAVKKERALQ